MRQKESKEIDGMRFEIQQLGGRAAARLFVRLNSYLIPALSQGTELIGKLDLSKGLGSSLDLGAIGRGLGQAAKTLLDKLTPEEFEAVASMFLESAFVQVNGKTVPLWANYDDLMAGKVLTQLKVLAFALEVNYRDFLPALGVLQNLTARASELVESNTLNQSGDAGA